MTASTSDEESKVKFWMRFAALGAVIVLVAGVLMVYGDRFSLEWMATRESQLRSFAEDSPWGAIGVAFLGYVLLTGLSLPGATGATLLLAWFFGFWKGLLLVSFASTTGATVAFLMSRFFLRDWVLARFGERLEGFQKALQREGAFYLFSLRLIPLVPFVVINLVMGLTPLRVGTFWWVSQLGMLPGTALYVYAGSAVPSLETLATDGVGSVLQPELLAAFVALGLFPLLAKKAIERWRPRKTAEGVVSPDQTLS